MEQRRLVLISDLHGWLPGDLPAGDLLVIAGDFCPIRDHSMERQQGWLEEKLRPWLDSLPYKDIVAIGGNHDFVAQKKPELVKELPWHYLQDETLWIQDLHLWGSPWAAPCGRWAFMKPEHKLAELYQEIPDNTDLVITHTPAVRAGDRVVSGKLVGSDSLRERMLKMRPALHVSGHIHEGRGHYQIGRETRSINASLLDENYQPWGWCYTVLLEQGEDSWQVAEVSEEPPQSEGYDFH